MKLLTKGQRDKLIRNYAENENLEDAKEHKIVVKLFNPTGIGTWYLTELNPYTNVAFGLAVLHEKEIGAIDFTELENFKGNFGLGIERDKYSKINITLRELKKELA